MRIPSHTRLLALLACVLAPHLAAADVKLPSIFGTHMVLQADIKIPVWGSAAPAEKISVSLAGQTVATTADATGHWRVDLKPIATGGPYQLVIKAANQITFDDVLIGDVWLCSGQSNMEFMVQQSHDAATEIPQATDDKIRLFLVAHQTAVQPRDDVAGHWAVCSPTTVPNFSAAGYYFAKELRKSVPHPIGLIGSYVGGMPAQAFTSLSGLQKDPPFPHYLAEYNKVLADYPKAKAAYPAEHADYQAKLKEWNETTGVTYRPLLQKYNQDLLAAQKADLPGPPKPAPAVPTPKAPVLPDGPPSTPTVLFNGMISPLIPYGIKGVLWYQGEANAGNGVEYETLFPRMISDWREKWNQGDFPFIFVQLANHLSPQKAPSEGGWAILRDAQRKTLTLPATGMAVAIDIGDGPNIHPRDKHDVGARLALVARHLAYGEALTYSGPLYQSMKIEGKAIRLTFDQTGQGLKFAAPPWTPNGIPAPTPTELNGFAIAGSDQQWHWAKAQIDGATVVVSSDEVPSPVAVRYGWANNPPCNLYNSANLPATPFRTDDWPLPLPVPMKPAAAATNAPPTSAAKP